MFRWPELGYMLFLTGIYEQDKVMRLFVYAWISGPVCDPLDLSALLKKLV